MSSSIIARRGAIALSLILAGLSNLAFAADKPCATGKWNWSVERNGQTVTTTLTLKQDGEKLTGTIDRSNTQTAIDDGTIKDGEVAFKVTRERDGAKFTINYKGKLTEDSIKGTSGYERDGKTNSRDWEAKRAKE